MAPERRVLLVEADTQLARLYVEQLRGDGIALECVSSAGEAEAFVRRRPPVLVLIDLALPDLRGKDLVEAWSQDPILAAIPVWIISDAIPEDNLWWHGAPNVQRYFLKSRIVLSRLSLEIRATLGLPYAQRIIGPRVAS